jgi:succinylglutamate desuccinylase
MHDPVAPEELAKWTRWFAIECNNRAWRLAEAEKRTAAEDEEMLHSAHAAALHWGKVGTDLHTARATMLLGHVHALLGDGARAIKYARQSFSFVMSHESPAWEVAFAHAVLANAAAAAGETELHRQHYGIAEALGEALPDAQERAIFEATFRRCTP